MRKKSSFACSIRMERAKSHVCRCPNIRTRYGMAVCPMCARIALWLSRSRALRYTVNGHRFNPNKLLIDPYARSLYRARSNGAICIVDTIPVTLDGICPLTSATTLHSCQMPGHRSDRCSGRRRCAAANSARAFRHLRIARAWLHNAPSGRRRSYPRNDGRTEASGRHPASAQGWGSRPWNCCLFTQLRPHVRWP